MGNSIPKAELHVHLENTVSPERARLLARRNGISLPEDGFTAGGGYRYSSFPDFLDLTARVASCLRTPQDYHEITTDYLRAAQAAGVVYQELIFWHGLPAQNGLTPQAAFEAVAEAAAEVEAEGGPLTVFQAVMVRHDGPDACAAAAEWAAELGHPRLRGVNLAGNEATHPPHLFDRAYAIAREAGLGIVIHAGEACGPESVEAALRIPGLSRIGHGVRAAEDPGLVSELARRGTVLELCPGSNIALGFYPDFEAHPLRHLYDAGVRLCLNSDDPPFFHTSITREYEIAAEHFGFTRKELTGLTATAIEAGFLTEEERAPLLHHLAVSQQGQQE